MPLYVYCIYIYNMYAKFLCSIYRCYADDDAQNTPGKRVNDVRLLCRDDGDGDGEVEREGEHTGVVCAQPSQY